MADDIKRVLGITNNGELIAGADRLRLVIAPNGSAKTTSLALPNVQGLTGNKHATVKNKTNRNDYFRQTPRQEFGSGLSASGKKHPDLLIPKTSQETGGVADDE